MNEQPEALRLADALDGWLATGCTLAQMDQAAAELRRLHAEVEEQCRLNGMGSEREAKLMAEVKALQADAERFRWLRDNSNQWSWNPSKYSDDVVSGFAANGTGYLGYSFAAAIDAAKEGT